jgi:hypothetical protein
MSIDNALLPAQVAVNIHILTTPFPVYRLILKVVLETILRPTVDVTGVEVYFAGDDDVNVFEKGQIKR